MNSMQYQQQLDSLVQRASEILKAPAKAVVLDTFIENELLKVARYTKPSKPVIGFARPGRRPREMAVPDPHVDPLHSRQRFG